ncbi:MAG: transcription elongation GreA/GreB family factor [Cyclobacteriaceae bacterium]|jgi:transcription elongation GreA/GreB family factor
MLLFEIKKKAISQSFELLGAKLDLLKSEMTALQLSSESETKSSMGDKYETAREMVEHERQKIQSQLETFQKQKQFLQQINLDTPHQSSKLGSIIRTDKGTFLLSIGLGKVSEDVFLLSPAAPIGQQLMSRKVGDQFTFNQKDYLIEEIA